MAIARAQVDLTIAEHEEQYDRLEHDLTGIHSLMGNQSNAPVADIPTLKTISETAMRYNSGAFDGAYEAHSAERSRSSLRWAADPALRKA